MNHYANSEERERLIAGLRELADFLDQDPEIPAPRSACVVVFPPDGSDAAMFAEIDSIAERIGARTNDINSPADHYRAIRDFGPVQYCAVAVPVEARKARLGND